MLSLNSRLQYIDDNLNSSVDNCILLQEERIYPYQEGTRAELVPHKYIFTGGKFENKTGFLNIL